MRVGNTVEGPASIFSTAKESAVLRETTVLGGDCRGQLTGRGRCPTVKSPAKSAVGSSAVEADGRGTSVLGRSDVAPPGL